MQNQNKALTNGSYERQSRSLVNSMKTAFNSIVIPKVRILFGFFWKFPISLGIEVYNLN